MRSSPLLAVVALASILTGVLGGPAGAQIRGEGTMLVRQSTDCSGTGNASMVYFPFTVLFTGFEPGEEGEVTAFAQPGGEQVGHRNVTVDEHGNRCEFVDGTVPPGQYKLVYDFGSGTGKQKVIRLIDAPIVTPTPTPTPTPSAEPSATPTPTVSPTATPTPTPTQTPTPTATASPSTAPPPSSGTPTPPPSSSAPPSVQGKITFRPLPSRAILARTGADPTWAVALAVVLLVAGICLIGLSRRRTPFA